MSNKPTKKELFNRLLNIEAVRRDNELLQFVTHEIELLDNRASNRKLTDKQIENQAITKNVVALMQENPNTIYTIGDLLKYVPELPEEMTCQRMTAIIRTLLPNVGTGQIKKIEEKRKSYFQLNR